MDSYAFGDVEKSAKFTSNGDLRITMPSMGVYSFTSAEPQVIIKVKRSVTNSTVKTFTVKGYTKMKGGTYTVYLNKGTYYVQITGNISQSKSSTWKYSSTFY